MRRFPLVLTLPLAVMAMLPLAHAEEPAAPPPFWPADQGPAPEPVAVAVAVATPIVRREAPAAVKEAISALATACAAWPKPALPAIDRVPSPANAEMLPEDETCEMLSQPGRAFTLALWFSGVLGGAVTIAGLVGFCFLRMVLVQMWTWRPRAVTLPWS